MARIDYYKKHKRKVRILILAIIFVVVLIATAIIVKEVSLRKRGNCILTLSEDKTHYIVTGFENRKEIVIPEEYRGLPVLEIALEPAQNRRRVEAVFIPGNIITVRGYFGSYHNLSTIIIDDGVEVIEKGAFHNTDYYNNKNNWKEGVLYIDKYLIEVDTSITGEYMVKGGTLYIANSAFSNCANLTNVVIPDSVTSIGNEAFSWCDSLTSVVIGDGVTSIGSSAFSWCDSLTSVVIGDGVTSIGGSAFENCRSLTSVVIGDSVTSIGSSAFYWCSSLTSVVIGDGVTSIGSSAFSDCTSLTSVCYKGTSSEWSSISKGSYNEDLTNATRYYYIENEADVPSDGGKYWCYDGDYIIGLVNTDKILLSYIGEETDLILPDYITQINERAFYWCGSLTSVVIPDGVTSIGAYAFRDCRSLTNVVIGDGVTSIGDYAFRDCDSLTSVEIPDSVTSIGEDAFFDCNRLTSVVIGDSVTSIGDDAFYNCNRLTSVYYKGTSSEWRSISKGSNNEDLTNATKYYYIENEADVPTGGGNYWHYVNGVPTVW